MEAQRVVLIDAVMRGRIAGEESSVRLCVAELTVDTEVEVRSQIVILNINRYREKAQRIQKVLDKDVDPAHAQVGRQAG